jgi:NTP pyrophosphatase (non-canonical NTP hydrolase)
MEKMFFSEVVAKSQKIREIYHRLEVKHHGSEWTIEEDALAFLTDAGLVGRLVMAQQGRWPAGKSEADDLEHKLGECIWWLVVLGERMGIDTEKALKSFLTRTQQQLKKPSKPASSRRKTRSVGSKEA